MISNEVCCLIADLTASRSSGLDVLARQRLADEFETFTDRLLVGGGAVLAQQELDDERR